MASAPQGEMPPDHRKTRASCDAKFRQELGVRAVDISTAPTNALIDNIQAKLQKAFALFAEPVDGISRTTLEINDLFAKASSTAKYTLRRIITVWELYPKVGGNTSTTDLRYCAVQAVRDEPQQGLAKSLAKILANAVDPEGADREPLPISQERITDLLLATKQQWVLWDCDMRTDKALDELIEDDTNVATYNTAQDRETTHNLTTAADMLGSKGLTTAAEEEIHGNVHVYVSGQVLQTAAEKASDAAATIAAAKEAETATSKAEGQAVNEKKTAAKEALKIAKEKAKVAKDAAKAAKDAEKHAKQLEKLARDAESGIAEASFPVLGPESSPSKSMMSTKDDEEASGDDEPTPRVYKKRGRKFKTASSPAKPGEIGSELSASGKTRPPGKLVPGGAADKWLRDEDEWGKAFILNDPKAPMPELYEAFNKHFANTAYRHPDVKNVAYRSDWIEFPTRNKGTRDLDVFWRSYQSVRQHFEAFKTHCMKGKKPTWEPLAENEAAHMPKRLPPPRPEVFRDEYETPIPPAPALTTAQLAMQQAQLAELAYGQPFISDSSPMGPPPSKRQKTAAVEPESEDSIMSEPTYRKVGGWTPVNMPENRTFTAYTPKRGEKASLARAEGIPSTIDPRVTGDPTAPGNWMTGKLQGHKRKKGQSQPEKAQAEPTTPEGEPELPVFVPYEDGDDLVDTLEDFVAQQSSGDDIEPTSGLSVRQEPSDEEGCEAALD